MGEEKMENSMAADILESDAAFRQQFDPLHPEFHAGDPRAVPTGGKRLPKGLEGCENWQNLPESEPPRSFVSSDESAYTRLGKLRESVGELKKLVASLATPVEVVMKAKMILVKPTTQEDPAKVEKYSNILADKILVRDKAIKELQLAGIYNSLQGTRIAEPPVVEVGSNGTVESVDELFEASTQRISDVISAACELTSTAEPSTKEEFADFGFRLSNLTRKLFAEQATLLSQMKKAKS